MFTLTVFEILLSKGRSVLSPAQRGTGSESVKMSSNNDQEKGIKNKIDTTGHDDR